MSEIAGASMHDEVKMLLPWYANGTLDSGEQRKVRAHLDDCEQCAADLVVLHQVRDGVKDASPMPLMREPQVDRFMAALDSDGRVTGWRVRWQAVAAVLTVAIAAAILVPVLLDQRTEPTLFETVTELGDARAMDYVLHLTLAPGMTDDERDRLFEDINVHAVYREASAGDYRVVIRLSATSLPELESFTDAVESRSDVISARAVALQLPVEAPD